MGIDGAGKCILEGHECIFAFALGQALDRRLITLGQQGFDVTLFLACQFQTQGIKFDTLPPQLIQFGRRFRPAGRFAVELISVLLREIKRSIQQAQRITQTLVTPLDALIVNMINSREFALIQAIEQCLAICFETIDITLQKQIPAVIQTLQIEVKHFLGEGVIQLDLLVMAMGKKSRDALAGDGVLFFLRQFWQLRRFNCRRNGQSQA